MKEEYLHKLISLFEDYKVFYDKRNCHLSRKEIRESTNLEHRIRKLCGSLGQFKADFDIWLLDNSNEEQDKKFELDLTCQKQIFKLQQKNNELRYQNKLLLKQISNQDIHYDYLIEKFPKEITYKKISTSQPIEYSEKEGTAILHLSDLHYGEVVQFGSTIYNCQIAEDRLSSIISQFCYIAQSYENAVVFINGDMINGSIHDEFNRTNEVTVTDAVLRISKVLAESMILIYESLRGEKNLSVVFTVGNHARIIPGDIYYKNKVKENWEYLLGEIVKSLLANTNIDVEICNTPAIVYQIEDLRFAVTHGDCFKSLSNIRVSVAKFQEMNMSTIGKFDNILLGHFHTTLISDILGGKLFVNGSLKGYDEYSIGNNFSISYPEQTCLVVNKDKITNIVILKAEV